MTLGEQSVGVSETNTYHPGFQHSNFSHLSPANALSCKRQLPFNRKGKLQQNTDDKRGLRGSQMGNTY